MFGWSLQGGRPNSILRVEFIKQRINEFSYLMSEAIMKKIKERGLAEPL